MRATGTLHLGNYLGAAKGMVALQNDPNYRTFYMVADLHALTTPFDVEELRQNRHNVIADYLAIGLDPEKSTLFFQSMVPEHVELAYYFSTVVSVARMQHLPTFKEKVKQYPEDVTMALLNYPILMAADILVYQAELVPVGIDQEPHLEIAREIARKLNQQYGLNLPEPKRFQTSGEYVPSLAGEGKMSKSVSGSFIALEDSFDVIKKKLAKVPTDSGRGRVEAISSAKKPGYRAKKRYLDSTTNQESKGVLALMTLVELFEGANARKEYEKAYESSGVRYGDLKAQLAEAIYKEIKPIQARKKEIIAQPDYLDQIIDSGAKKARQVAGETVSMVRQAIGIAQLGVNS